MSIWKGKSGPLLVSEIVRSHEGDFQYAKNLLATESGIDYVLEKCPCKIWKTSKINWRLFK